MPPEAYPTHLARATVDVLARAVAAAAAASSDSKALSTSSDILPTGVSSIGGQPSPTSTSTSDPLLALMPDFAFSMPAQVVVAGVNLALVATLTIHLLFTIHYHYPLSKRNYSLQIGSSLMLLISVSVQIHAIFDILKQKSMIWPYMFSYIGIQIPPQDGSWDEVQRVFYLLMRALTTALVHLTHIQFLTLLFPSALEARLIFWMLGPLALAASGMEFTSLSPYSDLKTSDLGDSIRNICNSTLTLLYTVALLIWGLAVNRQRAWRTDGGTASFGAGSVGLALINTAISFVEIAYDRLWWLPDVCWTLTIWQSWLGFWWWVGAGMGIGEVEDRAERVAKKRKREERKRRKLEKAARLKKKQELAESGETSLANGGDSDVLENMRRFTGRIVSGIGSNSSNDGSGILNRRRRRNNINNNIDNDNHRQREANQETENRVQQNSVVENQTRAGEEGISVAIESRPSRSRSQTRPEASPNDQHGEGALESIAIVGDRNDDQEETSERTRDGESRPHITATAATDDGVTVADSANSNSTNPTGTGLSSSQTSSGGSGFIDSIMRSVISHQPDFIRRRMKRLRLEHVAAARVAAGEQAALREQVMNLNRGRDNPGLRTMMMGNGRDENGEILPGNNGRGNNNNSQQQVGSSSIHSNHPRIRSLHNDTNQSHQNARVSSPSSQNRALHHQDQPAASLRSNRTGEDQLTGTTALESGNNSSNQNHSSSDDIRDRPTGENQGSREDQDDDAWVEEDEDDQDDDDDDVGEGEIPRAGSPSNNDTFSPRNRSRNQEEETNRQAGSNRGEEENGRSWYWRGGLQRARLRDRQTYD